MKLTNETIRRAKPGDTLRDETVRGLHLRVFANSKRYYLHYRTREGRERRPKLGDAASLSLAEARKLARAYLGDVAAGNDPMAQYVAARKAKSVSDLMDRYMKDRGERRASSKERQRMIDKYILPDLGTLRVPDVTYEHIAALHSSMEASPVQANRVLALLSTAFGYAETLGWRVRGQNPCKGVERFPERKRKRYAQGDELGKIAELLHGHKEKYPRAVLFIWLLVYTGARPDEVARFQIDQVQGNKIVLDHHKTEHTGDARVVHLPPQVIDLIGKLEHKDGALVGIQHPKHLWNKIRAEAGCKDLRLYDLRHTFASAALAMGYSLSQIGELLGHKSAQTTHRYAHLLDEAAQAATTATADYLDRMMKATSEVEQ